jgi:hypothetical protein
MRWCDINSLYTRIRRWFTGFYMVECVCMCRFIIHGSCRWSIRCRTVLHHLLKLHRFGDSHVNWLIRNMTDNKTMTNYVFWNITSCRPLKVDRRFGWNVGWFSWRFLTWLTLQPWSWRRHVPAKPRLTLNVLHCFIFPKIFLSGARLSSLGTAATTVLLYQSQMIDGGDYEAIGGIKIGRGNRSTRRKPAPAPLCPPQILHDQSSSRTRAAAVGSQRLTARAMARAYIPEDKTLHIHYSELLISYISFILWNFVKMADFLHESHRLFCSATSIIRDIVHMNNVSKIDCISFFGQTVEL